MPNPTLTVAADDQASQVLAGVRSRLEDLFQGFANFGALANRLSIPLLGVTAAIVGIGAAVSNALRVTRWVDDLVESGSALGLTADNMAKFQIMAKSAGIEANQLSQIFSTLAKNIEGAKAGQHAQVDLFRRLGISVRELRELSPDELFVRVAKASNELQSGFAKVAIQGEAVGRGGKRIDEAFRNIASSMQVNTGLTQDFVHQSQQLDKELTQLSIAWSRYSVLLAGPVVDALLLVARAAGLIEKTPTQQRENLVTEIERWEKAVKARQSSIDARGGRFIAPAEIASLETASKRLAELRGELQAIDQQMERSSARDAPGAREVPGKEKDISSEVAAALARQKRIAEALAREELQFRVEHQRQMLAIDQELVVNNVRMLVQKQEDNKRYWEENARLIEKYEQDQADAIRKGAEVISERRRRAIDEVEDEIDRLTSVTESFFLKLTDFESVDVFKTLGKDLAQVAYRMIVLEPILERLRAAMKAIATERIDSGGGSWLSVIARIAGAYFGTSNNSAAVSAGAFDAALGGPAHFAQVVGESGPELFIPKTAGTIIPNHLAGGMGGGVTIVNNNVIDSRTDQGTIAAMLEANRQATLRDVREQLARRGSMLRV